MVSNELLYFLPVALGVSLIVIGMKQQEAYTGMFGGIVLFLTGVSVLINPTTFPSLLNDVLGTVLWGFGAYVVLRGAIEESTMPSSE